MDKKSLLYGITLSSVGGAQSVLYQLISNLNDNYNITLVTSPSGELIEKINSLNKNRENKVNIITIKNLKREISPLNDFISLIKLIKIMHRGKFQIVHLHSSKMGVIGSLAARICHIPKIIFTVHGFGITNKDTGIKRRILSLVLHFSLNCCTKVVCVSNQTKLEGITNNWVKEDKSTVIYNGSDYSVTIDKNSQRNRRIKLRTELSIPGNNFVIGSVMRFDEPKDPFFTIKVADNLIKRGYRIKLVFIGDGPLLPPSIKLAKDLNIESSVYFLGERKDVPDLIEGFNLFTLFSKSEALPMSIIEAMFAGNPIVASNVGGISELVYPYENGFLIQDESLEDASAAIETIIKNPLMYHRFANKSLSLAENSFTSRKMASGYEVLYNESTDLIKKNPILKKFSYLFLGNLVYSISKALTIIIITIFGSPSLVGEYSLSIAITTPLYMSLDLGLSTVYVTSKDDVSFNHYFNFRLISSILALLISIIISLLFKGEIGLIIISISLYKFFEFIADILYGFFQKKEMMKTIGLSKALKSVLSIITTFTLFYFTKNLFIVMLSVAGVWGVFLLFYDIPVLMKFNKLRLILNKNILVNLIKMSLPLGVVFIIDTLNSSVPSYFIGGFLGSDLLGYYSSIAYIVVSGDIVINSISDSVLPKLSYFYREFKNKYYHTIFKLVTISAGLGLIALSFVVVLGRSFLTFLYGSDYGKYYNIFIILMASSCMSYISRFLNKGIIAAQKFKVQQILYLITFLTNIVLYAVLIKEYGLNGACYAALVSSQLVLFANLLILKKI